LKKIDGIEGIIVFDLELSEIARAAWFNENIPMEVGNLTSKFGLHFLYKWLYVQRENAIFTKVLTCFCEIHDTL
jgi:hypothetical protein